MSSDLSTVVEARPGASWLQARRTDAVERAEAAALPTADQEVWRYSRIGDLHLERFPTLTAPAPAQPTEALAAVLAEAGPADVVMWTVDGALGGVDDPGGLIVEDEGALGRAFGAGHDAFGALNDAVATPVQVRSAAARRVVVVHAVTAPGLAATRLVVEAAPGSDVDVVEVFLSPDGLDALVLPVTELVVDRDARLRYRSLQLHGDRTWQVGDLAAIVDQGGWLHAGVAAFGGDYARLRIDTRLHGRGAHGEVAAASFGSGSQLIDFRTFQDHAAPDTTSNLLFVGVLGERSGSVYSGLIKIRPEGRGANAFQTNRNLKLSDECWAESVPNLEIENNEVHCSHASTVGPIDPDHRFYLESRGVPADRAERLLVRGFFDDVVSSMQAGSLRARIDGEIDRKLERTLA